MYMYCGKSLWDLHMSPSNTPYCLVKGIHFSSIRIVNVCVTFRGVGPLKCLQKVERTLANHSNHLLLQKEGFGPRENKHRKLTSAWTTRKLPYPRGVATKTMKSFNAISIRDCIEKSKSETLKERFYK